MSPFYSLLLTSGVGTLLALIVTSVYNWLKDKRHGVSKKLEARFDRLQDQLNTINKKVDDVQTSVQGYEIHIRETTDKALQALLRNELYEIYDYWMVRKYAPTDVKENFENLYQRYHALGKNGVMDGKREAFMQLPDIKKRKEDTE